MRRFVLDRRFLATVVLGNNGEAKDGDASTGAGECQKRVCVIPGVHYDLGETCGAACCKRFFVV